MEKRDEFVFFLNEALRDVRLSAIIIFDNNPKYTVSYPHRSTQSSLEIIYAPEGLSADDYIVEYLEICRNKPTLITSDNELEARAALLRIKTLSVTDFFLLLSTKTKKSSSKEKPSQETPRQMKRYLSLFTQEEND